MAYPIIETERLILRGFTTDDAEAFFKLNSDPLVTRYTGDRAPATVDEARKILLDHPIADYAKHGYGRWAVVLKESGELIGFSGLKYLEEMAQVDVGYRLLTAHWGKGLATEAARPAIAYGFEELGLDRIIGLVEPANEASVEVLKKLGLHFDGMVEYCKHLVACYTITLDQFNEENTSRQT